MKGLMSAFRIDDLPLESKMLTSSLDEAQKKVEQYYYELRCVALQSTRKKAKSTRKGQYGTHGKSKWRLKESVSFLGMMSWLNVLGEGGSGRVSKRAQLRISKGF
jgi:hypothetical protein